MHFAPDVELSLLAAAELVNSDATIRRDGTDTLATVAELSDFFTRFRYAVRHDETIAELEEVRSLRPALRRFWQVSDSGLVDEINAMLRRCQALPQLVKHDAWDWHLHATPPEAPLAVCIQAETAMALVDVVRAGETERLRLCEGEGCDAVVVDLSRNRSRRYCDVNNCGNRAHVEAYRARRARA